MNTAALREQISRAHQHEATTGQLAQQLEKQLPRATWSSLAITQSNDFKKTLLHLVVSTPVEGKKP